VSVGTYSVPYAETAPNLACQCHKLYVFVEYLENLTVAPYFAVDWEWLCLTMLT